MRVCEVSDPGNLSFRIERSTARTRANEVRRAQVGRARRGRLKLCQQLVRVRGANDEMAASVLRILRAWARLTEIRPRVAMTLDLHHVSGLKVCNIASVLGRSLQTSALDLRLGHAWLARAIDCELD